MERKKARESGQGRTRMAMEMLRGTGAKFVRFFSHGVDGMLPMLPRQQHVAKAVKLVAD